MSRLLVFQMSNNTNPNGSPATPWTDANDDFATAISDPIKAYKVAPKGMTWRIYSVMFWLLTLNVAVLDQEQAGNINIDLNLWNEHKHQFGRGTPQQRIARARVYYNEFPPNMHHGLRDRTDAADNWRINPGTGDVFSDFRSIVGSEFNPFSNTAWYAWRPQTSWQFHSGLIVAPYLYFSVTHGGRNNMQKYLAAETVFGCSIEYDLVNRLKWREIPFVDN